MKHLRTIEWLIIIPGSILILIGTKDFPNMEFWNCLIIGGLPIALTLLDKHTKIRDISSIIALITYMIINFFI